MLFDLPDAIFKHNDVWSFRSNFQLAVKLTKNLAKIEVELCVSLNGDIKWVKKYER